MLYQSVVMKSEVLKTRIYLFKILKRTEFHLNYDYPSKGRNVNEKLTWSPTLGLDRRLL